MGFDTFDHDLLQGLYVTFGLSGTILNWFRSHLINRILSVVVVGTAHLVCSECFKLCSWGVFYSLLIFKHHTPSLLGPALLRVCRPWPRFPEPTCLRHHTPVSWKLGYSSTNGKMNHDKTNVFPKSSSNKLDWVPSILSTFYFLGLNISLWHIAGIFALHSTPHYLLNIISMQSAHLSQTLQCQRSCCPGWIIENLYLPISLFSDKLQMAQNNAAWVVFQRRKGTLPKPSSYMTIRLCCWCYDLQRTCLRYWCFTICLFSLYVLHSFLSGPTYLHLKPSNPTASSISLKIILYDQKCCPHSSSSRLHPWIYCHGILCWHSCLLWGWLSIRW